MAKQDDVSQRQKRSIGMSGIRKAIARRPTRNARVRDYQAIDYGPTRQRGSEMTLLPANDGIHRPISRNLLPTAPDNQGYALPAMTATVSPAALAVLAARIRAKAESYEIPVKPRSILDQNNLPCCVSCALASAMEIRNQSYPPLAPLFHYYVTRNGRSNAVTFLSLDEGLAMLETAGICREDLHRKPYTETGAAEKPSGDAYVDAKTRALRRPNLSQRRCLHVSGPSKVVWICEQLRQNHPIVFGFTLPTTYPKSFLNRKFEWLDPKSFPVSSSGHCVLATGYDDARSAIHIQDSKGDRMFDNGHWWMGYKVVESLFFQDAYSLIP